MGETDYLTRGTSILTQVGTTPGIGADPRRVGLIVSFTTALQVIQITAVGAPDDDHVITITPDSPALLTFKDWGPLLSYGWDVIDTVGNTTVKFVEVLYNKRSG